MRIWLMKMTSVLERLMLAVSLRSACDIRRACRPICGSPISPSISALGVSAATESITTTSTEPERTSMSAISSACSPLSGCEMSRSSTFTPSLLRVLRVERVLGVDEGGGAAQLLHLRRSPAASAWSCRRIPGRRSRPRGRAAGRRRRARCPARASRWTPPRCRWTTSCSPRRMIEPLPNCFSICDRAACKALRLLSSMMLASSFSMIIGILP